MEKIYAGIGSRRLTADQLKICRWIGYRLAKRGWMLSTGAAKGADQAFAEGALRAGGKVILHLPWWSYEKEWVDAMCARYGDQIIIDVLDPKKDKEALHSVEIYHPAWYRLSQGALKLHARNYKIVKDVEIILAWPVNNSGGTMQGIRIAEDLGIRVLRLDDDKMLRRIIRKLKQE